MVIYLNMFGSILFYSLKIFTIEVTYKFLRFHCKENAPGLSTVFWFQFEVIEYLLIAEEFVLFDDLTFIKGIVDCPYFPFGVGKGPFVVLLHEDVVWFFHFALEDYVETIWICACLFDSLLWKVEL